MIVTKRRRGSDSSEGDEMYFSSTSLMHVSIALKHLQKIPIMHIEHNQHDSISKPRLLQMVKVMHFALRKIKASSSPNATVLVVVVEESSPTRTCLIIQSFSPAPMYTCHPISPRTNTLYATGASISFPPPCHPTSTASSQSTNSTRKTRRSGP